MISKNLLWSLRNDLPMARAIAFLGCEGPYGKEIEGYFRFECPYCHEIRATVNPKNNLAHCFTCRRNINNIDLMLSLGYDFREAVGILRIWLRMHQDGKVPDASQNTRVSV